MPWGMTMKHCAHAYQVVYQDRWSVYWYWYGSALLMCTHYVLLGVHHMDMSLSMLSVY